MTQIIKNYPSSISNRFQKNFCFGLKFKTIRDQIQKILQIIDQLIYLISTISKIVLFLENEDIELERKRKNMGKMFNGSGFGRRKKNINYCK